MKTYSTQGRYKAHKKEWVKKKILENPNLQEAIRRRGFHKHNRAGKVGGMEKIWRVCCGCSSKDQGGGMEVDTGRKRNGHQCQEHRQVEVP